MILLATTELGTDSWISSIMQGVLASPTKGVLFLVYTSFIMFILRFFAGPIVHKLSPLGLLAVCAAVASVGLFWLANAGAVVGILFLAATLYGFGKTFFLADDIGCGGRAVSPWRCAHAERDGWHGHDCGRRARQSVDWHGARRHLERQFESAVSCNPGQRCCGRTRRFWHKGSRQSIKANRGLPEEERHAFDAVQSHAQQSALAKIAVLPAMMFVCYLILIAYFRARGGYEAQVLTGHAAEDDEFTGGLPAPGEA